MVVTKCATKGYHFTLKIAHAQHFKGFFLRVYKHEKISDLVNNGMFVFYGRKAIFNTLCISEIEYYSAHFIKWKI